eukprot:5783200-Amphidinium_carterae.1
MALNPPCSLHAAFPSVAVTPALISLRPFLLSSRDTCGGVRCRLVTKQLAIFELVVHALLAQVMDHQFSHSMALALTTIGAGMHAVVRVGRGGSEGCLVDHAR